MCKLYLSASRELLEAQFGVHPPADCVEGEVQPFGKGMLIRSGESGLVCTAAYWGDIGAQERSGPCTPEGSHTASPSSPRLNCTIDADMVADDPVTRAAWRWGQRCLVPASWVLQAESRCCHASPHGLMTASEEALALAGVWFVRPSPTSTRDAVCFSMLTTLGPRCPAVSALCQGPRQCLSVVAIARKHWVDWLEGSNRAAKLVLQTSVAAGDLPAALNWCGRWRRMSSAAIDRRERRVDYNVPKDCFALALTDDSLH